MIDIDFYTRFIDKIRPDGRKLDEIRPLSSEVSLLPRVHGSGLFTRRQTQALSACTLAPLGEHQIIDGLGVEVSKRFIHHYNFPQFSVGSTGRAGSPGRREIGSRLLEALPKLAKKANRSVIGLSVDEKNPKAKKLYERHGFKVVGQRMISGHLYDHMQKNI